MNPKPQNLEEALRGLADSSTPEAQKWAILAIILREFMLAEGVDMEEDIDPE